MLTTIKIPLDYISRFDNENFYTFNYTWPVLRSATASCISKGIGAITPESDGTASVDIWAKPNYSLYILAICKI